MYRPTGAHANADGLSRLPVPDCIPEGNPEDATIFMIGQLEALPVPASSIAAETASDCILKRVVQYLRGGWPKNVPEALLPFWRRRDELTLEDDCILWGMRVVIPKKLQSQVLTELHQGHPGIVKMKVVARTHVWWASVDHDIEQCARACKACQVSRNLPAKAPLQPWAWPTLPWERIHVDFAGPLQGKMMLVVIDAHSKWPDVVVLTSTTATRTIEALRELFARFGIPKQLVSDNGPQFISQEFASFLSKNGVKHIRTAPYHPASNGAAERMVKSVKRGVKAGMRNGVPLERALQAFLLRYRSTPHTTTGLTPSTLMLGRDLRTRLDLLRPELLERVEEKQAQQTRYHNLHCKRRELAPGTAVWARNWREGATWIRGHVRDCLGPVSYRVKLENGQSWRRHIDHLRERFEDNPTDSSSAVDDSTDSLPDSDPREELVPPVQETPMPEPVVPTLESPQPISEYSNSCTPSTTVRPDRETCPGSEQPASEQELTNRRYPHRLHQPPEWLYSRLAAEQT